MALSTVIKNFRDLSSVTFKDGTGTPLECSPPFYNADLKISNLGASYNSSTGIYSDYTIIKTKGQRVGIRKTIDREPQLTMTFFVGDLYNTATNCLNAFIHRIGTAYSAAISTTSTIGDVFTCDAVFKIEGTDHGDSADQTVTCEDIIINHDFELSADGNMLTVTADVTGGIFYT